MGERFGLYLVLTDPRAGYARCTEAAVAAGVRYVQLRMKDAPRKDLLATARLMRSVTRGTETRLVINDDPSVAAEVGADGAHLGQEDMPLAEARLRWPQIRAWGLSTHNDAQAQAAEALAPTYIGAGPVFPTPTKARPDPTLGLHALRSIVARTRLTVVAIGGIDAGRIPDVARAGAANFAVVRAVCASADPLDAIGRLHDAWRQAQASLA